MTAERALMAALEAGCAAPLGALGEVVEGEDGDELFLRTVVASVDGAVTIRRSTTGGVDAAERLGKELAVQLLEDGAGELVPRLGGRPAAPAARGGRDPNDVNDLREPATGPVEVTDHSASTPREGDS